MGNFHTDWRSNLAVAVSLAGGAVCMDKIAAIIGEFTLCTESFSDTDDFLVLQ